MFDFFQKLFGFNKQTDNNDTETPKNLVVKDALTRVEFSQEKEIGQI